MRRSFIITRIPLFVLTFLIVGATPVRGQVPLVTDQVVTPDVRSIVILEWQIDAAERALRSGLAGLAEKSYRTLLDDGSISTDQADFFRVRLAAALIAQRKFPSARTILEEVSPQRRDSTYYLYLGVARFGDGKQVDAASIVDALERVDQSELEAFDRPWYHLLKGLAAEASGDQDAVLPAFEMAADAAVSVEQEAFFNSLVFRQRILQTPSSEDLALEVRNQLQRLKDSSAAYPYAREYMIILYNLGRVEQAIEESIEARKNPNLSNYERGQLRLLAAVIRGVDSSAGQQLLRELIVDVDQSPEVLRMALQLLASSSGAITGSFSDFLNELIASPQAHPILGQIYYIHSQLALARAEEALSNAENAMARNEEALANELQETARQEISIAEDDARRLLEQFPGLSQITNVYRLLAYAALQRTPRQYRAAADSLIQLRDQTQRNLDRKILNRLIGDCYFLNADYTNAVDFYKAARYRELGDNNDGELFLRLITAEVRSGQIESALSHIDEADFSGGVSDADRWRAEWNVAQALRASGQLDLALERTRLLIQGGSSNVPTTLVLRLRWLEAYLSFLARDSENLIERVDALLARIESFPPEKVALEPIETKLLVTEILLLKAKILIRSGDASGGTEVMNLIRTGYAQSSAAQRSYITEADYYGSVGDYSSAQATLSKLASTYPSSMLAPQAVFEAAIYCERRGPDFYEAAALLLNNIALEYPNDELVYSARLKQGDLLRKMNKFAAAQNLYENLINDYPTHPSRYIAELSRADCMLALAKNNESQLNAVIIALEQLIDLPNLPIDFQAEVGYKWGFALLKRDLSDQAQEVFTMIASRFLLNADQASLLGPSGRYWMSRALLALGRLLEEQGDVAEARRVYIKMVAFNLPGRKLAQDRVDIINRVE